MPHHGGIHYVRRPQETIRPGQSQTSVGGKFWKQTDIPSRPDDQNSLRGKKLNDIAKLALDIYHKPSREPSQETHPSFRNRRHCHNRRQSYLYRPIWFVQRRGRGRVRLVEIASMGMLVAFTSLGGR